MMQKALLYAATAGVIVAVLPTVVTNNYYLTVLTFIAINTILAIGLNLLMGYAGLISLGHGAFFGLGAYCTAILTTRFSIDPWIALLAGASLNAAVAFTVGIPTLKLKGHYLAMATLGVGWIINIVMVQWTPVTNGTSGIESIPKMALGTVVFESDTARFYLAWFFALVALVLSSNLMSSRIGRAIRAIHFSEKAAATSGIDIPRTRIVVFVFSAVLASIAGSLYAHTVGFISPSAFGFLLSVELVVMVVVGGMGSILGAVVGATAITLLVEWLRSLSQVVPQLQNLEMIAHGAILMLGVILLPQGIVNGFYEFFVHIKSRRKVKEVSPDGSPLER